jgi:hypothetical protein
MKNLYQILGVLDTAEDIVIRAAYKALAQRYHPDKWQGNAEEATVRMREINDAYRILSDPIEKAKYDKTLDKKEYQEEPDIEENIDASLEDAWKVGLVFFPKLDELYLRLRKTNYSLGNTFKLIVIENKAFDKGSDIAEKMEKEFLVKYFGDDEKILHFAKLLINSGNKQGVKVLNKYIGILGKSVKAQVIIDKVRGEVKCDFTGIAEAMATYKEYGLVANAIALLISLGYRVKVTTPNLPSFLNPHLFESFIVTKDGKDAQFNAVSLLEFANQLVIKYYSGKF